MSEEQSSRFPKLNDTNYVEWAMRMEAELIRRGLWTMIEVPIDETGKDEAEIEAELETKKAKRGAQKMAEARSEMILRVEDGQLSHMRSRDPMEIWEMLRSVHRARGFATSLALRRKFLTTKKRADQSMQSWIGSVQKQVFTMEESGTAVTPLDIILALTMGLPTTYDAVIINFDSTPSDQLTFDKVVIRLLNEEVRQDSATTNPNPTDAVLTTTMSRTPRSDVTCHFCDKKGHFKAECRDKIKWEETKKKDSAHLAILEENIVW